MQNFPAALRSISASLPTPQLLGESPIIAKTIVNRFCGDTATCGYDQVGTAVGWRTRGCLVVTTSVAVVNQAVVDLHTSATKQQRQRLIQLATLMTPSTPPSTAETSQLSALLNSTTPTARLIDCLQILLSFRTIRSRRQCLLLPLQALEQLVL